MPITSDPEWELMPYALESMVDSYTELATIKRDRASEFTPLETPRVFSPVDRNGDYSISKSVFGKHSRIFIICDTNFRLFEILPDFEICTLRN